jgi:hypothetical protein
MLRDQGLIVTRKPGIDCKPKESNIRALPYAVLYVESYGHDEKSSGSTRTINLVDTNLVRIDWLSCNLVLHRWHCLETSI